MLWKSYRITYGKLAVSEAIYEDAFESPDLDKYTVGMRDLILCLLPWEYKASVTPIQEYILDIDILWGLTLQTFQVTN